MLKTRPPQELVGVIRQVHEGKKRIPPEIAAHLAEHYSDEWLTGREVDILRQLAGGNRNRESAGKHEARLGRVRCWRVWWRVWGGMRKTNEQSFLRG
jgi:hypothetical protein